MKKELPYFYIDGLPGGNQDWFVDPMMHLGGCAAVCACDSTVYFSRFFGLDSACPFGAKEPDKKDYIGFSRLMKPYLRPRWTGIDKPSIYIEGYSRYLSEHGEHRIAMSSLSGDDSWESARSAIEAQIDSSLPVPYLMLNHKNAAFDDLQWHWFMVTGYDTLEDDFLIKIVTYSEELWISLPQLWATECSPKGGLIIYALKSEERDSKAISPDCDE